MATGHGYISVERAVSAQGAAFALAAFWAMVTAGRVLIAFLSRAVPARWIYVALPILLLIVFQVSSRVQDEAEGIVVFGLAGLACSAFLPLSISFGGDEFPYLSAVMAGESIASINSATGSLRSDSVRCGLGSACRSPRSSRSGASSPCRWSSSPGSSSGDLLLLDSIRP